MISYFRNTDNGEFRMVGLSTDTKPTDDVPNGATFIEMDTDKSYLFDAEGVTYYEVASGGGGSGGGDSEMFYTIRIIAEGDDPETATYRLDGDFDEIPKSGKVFVVELQTSFGSFYKMVQDFSVVEDSGVTILSLSVIDSMNVATDSLWLSIGVYNISSNETVTFNVENYTIGA